jgi:PAS domain S-box-containing protein
LRAGATPFENGRDSVSSIQQQWLDQITGVLETLNQGVIINDEQRRVVFANSLFLEMIKLKAEQLLGRAITELFPTEDVTRLVEFIGRRETQGRAQYEFYIPQSDGGRLPVAVTARQVRPFHGQAFSIVTATDISELKRAEWDLRQANTLLLARQRQMEEELRLAERVQQSLTPKSLTWGRFSVEAYYRPAWSIGGDYGLVRPSSDCLDVLVCDVSGHGISSALIANRIYSETMAQIESGAERRFPLSAAFNVLPIHSDRLCSATRACASIARKSSGANRTGTIRPLASPFGNRGRPV